MDISTQSSVSELVDTIKSSNIHEKAVSTLLFIEWSNDFPSYTDLYPLFQVLQESKMKAQ